MKTATGSAAAATGSVDAHAFAARTAVLPGAQVLVVEDEPTIARTLADDLADHGYHVVPTGNGAEAIRLIAAHEFAAVITDLRLPGADGVEVLRAAKQRRAATRVLVISANLASRLPVVRGLGADDVLSKPFLNQRVLDWLGARV